MLLSDVRLSDICLSVAYIGSKSRQKNPRKTKIGTEVAHVTHDLDTTFEVEGQGHQAGLLTVAFTHRQLQQSAREHIERDKLLLRCRLQARRSARQREELNGAHRGKRGAGISCRHARSLLTRTSLQSLTLFVARQKGRPASEKLGVGL